MEDTNEPLWNLFGPFGYAECFKVDGKFVLYFEPYGNGTEYIKPMLVGTYDKAWLATKAADEITGTVELEHVDVSDFKNDSDADNIKLQ